MNDMRMMLSIYKAAGDMQDKIEEEKDREIRVLEEIQAQIFEKFKRYIGLDDMDMETDRLMDIMCDIEDITEQEKKIRLLKEEIRYGGISG